jgi:hypothetical protein
MKSTWLFVTASSITLVMTSALAAPPVKDTPQGSTAQDWDRNFAGSEGFVLLSVFGNEAVLDRNTGIVWEQTLGNTIRAWGDATWFCANKVVGGATG